VAEFAESQRAINNPKTKIMGRIMVSFQRSVACQGNVVLAVNHPKLWPFHDQSILREPSDEFAPIWPGSLTVTH
jgi:hypothetical protein